MNREELDEQLEAWLDRAAAEYGRAEARSGFEVRVVANLNSRLKRRKRFFRWTSLAAACTAILLGTFYVLVPKFRGPVEIATEISGKMKPALQQSPSRESRPRTIASELSPRNITKRPMRTEQANFLSGGLTDQERYLIAFVQAIPAEGASDQAQEFIFSPLQIPPLDKIQALQIPKPEFPFIETNSPTFNGSEEPL